MVEQLFKSISQNTDTRQKLIELRKVLKTEKGIQEFNIKRSVYTDKLAELLKDNDPKTRKNAVLILGEISAQEKLGEMMCAYETEEQLFIKSAYPTAIGNLNYNEYVDLLCEKLELLNKTELTDENRKHISEEKKALRELVGSLDNGPAHEFGGYEIPTDIMLMVTPGLEKLTWDALTIEERETARQVQGAIYLRTERIKKLLKLRTVREIVFRFCKNPLPATDYQSVARAVMDARLLAYLNRRHSGAASWRFRIDLRSKLVLREKSQYIKRLGIAIEELSKGRLINSPSDYEIELRIIEDKRGRYHMYLVMHTLPDTRFSYRKHTIATSMHPVRAAEIVSLASKYIMEDAVVLDPFCGTGTLMIERYKHKNTANMYGVDIYGEAIKYAKLNAAAAGMLSYFINRDFADFNHKYKFDEIITEMPAITDKMTAGMLRLLYKKWIDKLPDWLGDGAHIIVLATEGTWLKELADRSGYLIIKEQIEIQSKRRETLFIFQYKRGM